MHKFETKNRGQKEERITALFCLSWNMWDYEMFVSLTLPEAKNMS